MSVVGTPVPGMDVARVRTRWTAPEFGRPVSVRDVGSRRPRMPDEVGVVDRETPRRNRDGNVPDDADESLGQEIVSFFLVAQHLGSGLDDQYQDSDVQQTTDHYRWEESEGFDELTTDGVPFSESGEQ